MEEILNLTRTHGSLVVLAAAFLEKIGLPVPALPFLVLAGCLVVDGPVSLSAALGAATLGALAADLAWFCVGRCYGRKALYFLCRLSLNPDSCAGRTEHYFRTRGTATILLSKLVPGMSALIPPLAGVLRMHVLRYALWDAGGSLLWAGLGLGIGMLFGAEVLSRLSSIQFVLLWTMLLIVAGFVLFKILYRRYLIRHYSVPKLGSGDLLYKIKSGQELTIVDLRNEEAFANSRVKIPGALRIPPAQFEAQRHLVPKDTEIVLYCT